MTNLDLVERAKEGDAVAFRALYDRHVDRIYRLAYRMAGDDDLARDWTQDAFLRAWERLGQFRGEAAFSTWLHQIAVSVALNGLRKRSREWKRTRSLDEAGDLDGGERVGGLDAGARERLERAVDALPEMYRTVLLMHDVEGYGHGEIAGALGVAVGTSKARLSRARARLRESLGDAMREYV